MPLSTRNTFDWSRQPDILDFREDARRLVLYQFPDYDIADTFLKARFEIIAAKALVLQILGTRDRDVRSPRSACAMVLSFVWQIIRARSKSLECSQRSYRDCEVPETTLISGMSEYISGVVPVVLSPRMLLLTVRRNRGSFLTRMSLVE